MTSDASQWVCSSGETVTIRAICPDDEPMMVRFHAGLSDTSVHLRYFSMTGVDLRSAHERLRRVCSPDPERETVLVAVWPGPGGAGSDIAGVARLTRTSHAGEAEIAVVIADSYQRRGLGRALLRALIALGEKSGIRRVVGIILPENAGMIHLCAELGFTVKADMDEGVVRAEYTIEATGGPL